MSKNRLTQVTITEKAGNIAHTTRRTCFTTFEAALEFLKEQGFEHQITMPCGTIIYFKHAKDEKEAYLEVPNASKSLTCYRSVQGDPSPAAGKPPVVLESLDSLRDAARKAIETLTEQAVRLKPAVERVNCLDAVLTHALPSWNALETCGMPSTADCTAAVKKFYLLAEEMLSKYGDAKQEADSINKALTHMKAALELLNA